MQMAQQQVLQFQPLRAKQVGLHAVHTDSSDTKKASQWLLAVVDFCWQLVVWGFQRVSKVAIDWFIQTWPGRFPTFPNSVLKTFDLWQRAVQSEPWTLDWRLLVPQGSMVAIATIPSHRKIGFHWWIWVLIFTERWVRKTLVLPCFYCEKPVICREVEPRHPEVRAQHRWLFPRQDWP